MRVLVRITFLAGLVAGLAGLPALAAQSQSQSQKPQSGQQQQQPATKQQPPAGQQPGAQAAPAAPKVNPAEEKAYKTFYNVPVSNPKAVVSSGNDFLSKFPDSHYKGSVYARLTNAYRELGDDTNMFKVGKQALEVNPNNVDVLAIMAYSIPRRIDPNNLDSTQQLQDAETYAKRGISLIPTMTKPANLTDEQFTTAKNAELASCHSGLGLVYYYQHNLNGMITELEQAVKLDPTPDPTDQFLLGFAYNSAGRYSDAIAPLTACASTPGPVAARCKTILNQAKKRAAAKPKQ